MSKSWVWHNPFAEEPEHPTHVLAMPAAPLHLFYRMPQVTLGRGNGFMLKILIIEDDPAVIDTVRATLPTDEYQTIAEGTGEMGLHRAQTEEFNLLIVDVGLPDLNGFELVRQLRESGDTRPVIFLTARAEEEDVVRGLGLGADGYIPKPFSMKELKARIDALFRVISRTRRHGLDIGDLRIDEVSREVTRAGAGIRLTELEYKILLTLAKAQGRVVTRETLLNKVWGIDFDPGTVTLDVHLSHLRKKLRQHGPNLIQSVRGKGWRIVDSL